MDVDLTLDGGSPFRIGGSPFLAGGSYNLIGWSHSTCCGSQIRGAGSQITDVGSPVRDAGSPIGSAGSQNRGAGSQIRQDPAEFKPWLVRTRKNSHLNVSSTGSDLNNYRHIRNQTLSSYVAPWFLETPAQCPICSAISRAFVTTEFYSVFRQSSRSQIGHTVINVL